MEGGSVTMSGNLFSIVNLDLNYSGTHRQWAFATIITIITFTLIMYIGI